MRLGIECERLCKDSSETKRNSSRARVTRIFFESRGDEQEQTCGREREREVLYWKQRMPTPLYHIYESVGRVSAQDRWVRKRKEKKAKERKKKDRDRIVSEGLHWFVGTVPAILVIVHRAWLEERSHCSRPEENRNSGLPWGIWTPAYRGLNDLPSDVLCSSVSFLCLCTPPRPARHRCRFTPW